MLKVLRVTFRLQVPHYLQNMIKHIFRDALQVFHDALQVFHDVLQVC